MDRGEGEFPVNCIRICIDEEKEETKGRICGVALESEIIFKRRTELVLKIDYAFDIIGQPQPHQVMRSFKQEEKTYNVYCGNPKRYNTSSKIREKHGKIKTMDLVMISRSQAEWQGILKDESGDMIGRFKSTIECMKWW